MKCVRCKKCGEFDDTKPTRKLRLIVIADRLRDAQYDGRTLPHFATDADLPVVLAHDGANHTPTNAHATSSIHWTLGSD